MTLMAVKGVKVPLPKGLESSVFQITFPRRFFRLHLLLRTFPDALYVIRVRRRAPARVWAAGRNELERVSMSVNGQVPVDQALAAYIRFFQELRPETLSRLDRLAVPDVHFKDPFNDFRSRDRMKAVFAGLLDRLDQPRFIVRDHALSEQTAFLRWGFVFRRRGQPRPSTIEGMSEVRFDLAGHVTSHVDHWDAAEQFYHTLPVLGWILRKIKAHMAE